MAVKSIDVCNIMIYGTVILNVICFAYPAFTSAIIKVGGRQYKVYNIFF